MRLRDLELKDAPLMLEWMHDEDVVKDLATNFMDKSIGDCESFIRDSFDKTNNLHFAIVSDDDEYMGTVSLKHIDRILHNAELGITVRKETMGKGYAWYGMAEILRYAFEELKLQSVYWCVSNDNFRACRFYDKHGFNQIVNIPQKAKSRYQEVDNLRWYSVDNGDNYRNNALSKGCVAGCKVINIKTIPTIDSGELSFFESNKDISFDIKRIYYISKVPEGIRRGFHAHKELKQLLFCPYGEIQLILDDGNNREEITLNNPSIGIVIEKPIWREMLWLKSDSVLCVAASDFYSEDDYIRDYNQFLKLINERK